MIYTSDFTKIDMHVHTKYTHASSISLKSIENFLNKHKDFGLAITDINTIDGAMMLNEKYPSRIIVGSQIMTKQGAVTGLFLKENIPPGQDINRTIDAILVQDGLIYVPHPLDRLRKTKLSSESLSSVLKRCDILEIFNSRTIHEEDDKSAIDLLEPHILPACGSDAHTMQEMGRTYMLLPSGIKLNSTGFYTALMDAELICRKTSVSALMQTKLYSKYKKITTK